MIRWSVCGEFYFLLYSKKVSMICARSSKEYIQNSSIKLTWMTPFSADCLLVGDSAGQLHRFDTTNDSIKETFCTHSSPHRTRIKGVGVISRESQNCPVAVSCCSEGVIVMWTVELDPAGSIQPLKYFETGLRLVCLGVQEDYGVTYKYLKKRILNSEILEKKKKKIKFFHQKMIFF
eukprot:GHVL01038750.1.p1 GENE.GHVL01038750.1~~GHVL01038750.1.p1  ORF type:complete len:196 (-),score=24.53 GHVL01038750.1:464-994(-)